MSNNNNNRNNKSNRAPPPFSGNSPPVDVHTCFDDVDDEVTRRVAVAPHFGPVPITPPTAPRAKIPPMMNMAQPAPAASQKPSSSSASAAPKSIFTKKESNAGKSTWVLRDVPTLPEFYPLERSAVFVPSANVESVAQRISRVLRERSIEAFYDNSKAKAKCVTADGVDFRIFLYRGRNRFSHGIIVEVQRRFGNSVNFHNDTKAILDAAEGKATPPVIVEALPFVPDVDDGYRQTTSSLAMISILLRHPGYDAQLLALQTLASLTDPLKMGRTTALKLSQALLEEDHQHDIEVRAKLVSLLDDNRLRDDESFELRVLAMSILGNALQVRAQNMPTDLCEQLRPVLLDELRKAKENPRMAFMAARCVEYLIPLDHNASEIHAALEEAREVGSDRHAALMRQAEQCIHKINNNR